MYENKVTLNILGTDYHLNTDEDTVYAAQLGEELDERLRGIRNSSSSVSVTQAAVLAALGYLDDLNKAQREIASLRASVKSYHDIVLKNKEEMDRLRKK